MSNQAYPLGFQAIGDKSLLGTQINLTADTLKLQCVGPLYVYSAAHQFLSDLTHTVGSPSAALTGVTYALAVLRALPTLISAVPVTLVSGVALYDVSVSNALLMFWDTADGLPFTGTGGDVSAVWDPGQFGIFQG